MLLSQSAHPGTQSVGLDRGLEVLNNLTIHSGVTLSCGAYNVSVGGNLTVDNGGSLTQTPASAAQIVF